ncbi:MAG: hypothetical protein WA880_07735, partial [Ornithinimicrobium sp.]
MSSQNLIAGVVGTTPAADGAVSFFVDVRHPFGIESVSDVIDHHTICGVEAVLVLFDIMLLRAITFTAVRAMAVTVVIEDMVHEQESPGVKRELEQHAFVLVF